MNRPTPFTLAARAAGLSPATVRKRIRSGWPPELHYAPLGTRWGHDDPPQWDHLEKLRAAADLSKAELSRRLHRQPAWYSQRHQSRRQLPESVVAEITAICEKAAKERVKAAMVAL